MLGGKPAPGVGFGLGIERLILLLTELGIEPPSSSPDVYAVVPDGAPLAQVMPALETLRTAGVDVLMHAGGGSMKSQFKKADGSGARHALVFGADELAAGQVTLKALRDGAGEQQRLALADVAAWAGRLRA